MIKLKSGTSLSNLGKYFHGLAQQSPDVFWIRAVDSETWLYVSPSYEKIWGLSCESLYKDNTSWLSLVHVDDKDRVKQFLAQIKSNPGERKTCSLEYRIKRLDEEIKHIQETHFPLYDSSHQLIGFAVVSKDMTEAKKQLTDLEKKSYFFRGFAEKVYAVFWVRDYYNNKQLYISPGYEKIWGRTCESLYENPETWVETLHPEDREKMSKDVRINRLNDRVTEEQFECCYRILTPEGEVRWIRDTSFPILDDRGNFVGFAGMAEDISKEILLQDAMKRAELANQAKSDFLAVMSHELRTPLNAILGMAQILKEKELSKELEENVDIISNAGNYLLFLVNDILDFARLEVGKLSFYEEPFNLRELFEQVVHGLQFQADEKKLKLNLKYHSDVESDVIGDVNRIRQVLINLVTNAIKFTERGYIKIDVSASLKTKTEGFFTVKVVDTGIGIQQDKLKSIFEKFSQIDSIYQRKHRGMGLGLSIVKQLVETMGGQIHVESEFGKGSEFEFTLSLKLQQKQKNQAEKKSQPSSEGIEKIQYGLKILLVEDNLINQKITKIMLEDFGCHVDIYSSGHKILEKPTLLLNYNIIFMDVGLPDISGFDIAARMRQIPALKNIPIVAITAHILEHDRKQAADAGMNRIIPKPISYEKIKMLLDEYVAKRSL